ncbi:ABC1-like kinase 8 [Pycnococcus provasolii]
MALMMSSYMTGSLMPSMPSMPSKSLGSRPRRGSGRGRFGLSGKQFQSSRGYLSLPGRRGNSFSGKAATTSSTTTSSSTTTTTSSSSSNNNNNSNAGLRILEPIIDTELNLIKPLIIDSPEEIKSLQDESGVCSPFRRYSPQLVRQNALEQPVEMVLRGTQIGISFASYLSSIWWDCVVGSGVQGTKRAVQLREMLASLGPTFIKMGQVLANRPDILRADFMAEMAVLQDDVPAFPDDVAFAIIEKNLGRPVNEVFEAMSDGPVAAASIGQVYRARLRGSGEEVAIKVQRPGVEPIIFRDLFLFRALAWLVNPYAIAALGVPAALIIDEFGEKLLEELDYTQEARNIEDFGRNFADDPTVKIPICYRNLSGRDVIVMEWIDGIRCTDPEAISRELDRDTFIRTGVVSGMRQLLEFGLFHGDPHPGNIFAMRDGRIAYVDFGNVSEVSNANKQTLIDSVVHAVNEDYVEMAYDFERLGFLAPGTDVTPIVPALEEIWQDAAVRDIGGFNFRTVTEKFNVLVFQYQIRIPERFSLVIRSLLTQEGICMTLNPQFRFLEVAYPYVARRLLTDPDPALRARLLEVLFKDGKFQWARLENLLELSADSGITLSSDGGDDGLDLKNTIRDIVRLVASDANLRLQLVEALTEGNRLHIPEAVRVASKLEGLIEGEDIATVTAESVPLLIRDFAESWSSSVLSR